MEQYATDNDDERNPHYPSWDVNCANYVSQSLVAGGGLEPISGVWDVSPRIEVKWGWVKWVYKSMAGGLRVFGANVYYNDETSNDYSVGVSNTWNNANAQFEYFSNSRNGYMNGEVIEINQNTNMEALLKKYNIQIGDIMYWGDDNHKGHATIISLVTDADIMYAGNTMARFDSSLSEAIEGQTVYIIRINDEKYNQTNDYRME